jgi:serine/threonine-protein kinase
MIGTRLAHYEVTSHLGTGGMGEVYRATDSKLGRSVAIKLLPEAFSRDADRAARFEREARVLASLNHPNIAAIYGLEESETKRFLVMELVEGDTLADRLQRGPIPVEESLKLALQIARALESAHEKGVIHRDIKPANIKVTADGKVKVLDFGLAKAFTPSEQDINLSNSPTMSMTSMAATQQGIIMGTAGYMSPEQASGESADKRADIWAFGVVLFEMLSGRRMFAGKTVAHILADILKAEPDWNSLPANLHPRLRLLLERCLEKEPQDRYHDIADARVDIERVLSDPQGVFVRPETVGTTARAGISPFVWIITAAVAVMAGALGWFLHPQPAPKPASVVRFPLLLPPATQFSLPPAMMLAISPDGTRIAHTGNNQLYLRNLNESESRPVPGTLEPGVGVSTPVFSPDGQWIAYVQLVTATGPYILKRVPVSGGTPVKVVETRAGILNFPVGLSWPSSETLVFVSPEGVVRMPANGGAPEILVKRTGDEALETPQLLPDGKQVLFVRLPQVPGAGRVSVWDAAEICIQSIGATDRTVVWKGGSHAQYLSSGHLLYAQGNTVFALALDIRSRKVMGGPVPVLEGIRRSSNGITDAAQYVLSDSGSLATLPGLLTSAVEKGVLASMDRKGAATPFNVKPAPYRHPRFSPDGKQVAVEILSDDGQTSSVWVYDVSGKSEIRRLTDVGKNSTRPVWTPDGKRITFGSDRDGAWGVYDQPSDGSALATRLTTAKDSHRQYPEAWSPDGKTLAFVELVNETNWDVWTLTVGGESKLVATGEGSQFGATFSPDGKWLAYTDNQNPFGIRVQPYPGTGVVRQVTQDGEAWPVWSGTNEMFFRLRRDAGQPAQLRGIDVSTTGEFTFRNPRSLQVPETLMYQNYRDYDVTRTGDKFVVLVPDQKEAKAKTVVDAPRIDVVLNWIEELKQRVPVR